MSSKNLFYVIYIRNSLDFMSSQILFYVIYQYIRSFKTIDLDEYKKLLKNKKKMFDMTFPTP